MLFQPNFSPRCISPRRFHRGSRARLTIHGLRISVRKNVVLSSADFTAGFFQTETMYGQRAAACPKTALKMLYLPAPISPRLFSGGRRKMVTRAAADRKAQKVLYRSSARPKGRKNVMVTKKAKA